MPKVYVVNNKVHDYSKAKRFGDLVNVTEGSVPIFKTDVVDKMVQDKLKHFTKDDYLLLSGPALLCIIASRIAFSKYDTVKFLIFDAKQQKYVARHLNK